MPTRLWIFAVLLFLQAMPLSAGLFGEVGGIERDDELLLGLNAARILVVAAIALLWVRRPWAWWTLVATQGIAVPLIVILPVLG